MFSTLGWHDQFPKIVFPFSDKASIRSSFQSQLLVENLAMSECPHLLYANLNFGKL